MADQRDKKIHVAALISSLNIGGYEIKMDLLAKHLDRERFKLTVILVYPEYKAQERHRKAGEAHRQFFQWEGVETVALPMKGRLDLRLVGLIASVLRDRSVDLLYFMAMGAGTFLGPLAGRRAGVKRIIRASDTVVKGMYPAPLKWLDRFLLGKTTHTIVPSYFLQELMVRELKMDAARISVINNGIDHRKFQGLATQAKAKLAMGLDPQSKTVGMVANLNPVKRHALLLEAAPKIVAANPSVHFVFMGDGPCRADLLAQVRALGIEKQVHFLGHRADVPQLLPGLDVGVFCSQVEVYPLSLIEMMSVGVPVAAMKVGGIPEIIDHGQNGFLVSDGDVHALAESVNQLLSMTDLARALSKNARKKASLLSVEHMVEQHAQCFMGQDLHD